MKRLVYGIGRNDADYPVYVYAVIDGKQKNLWICPFYRAWTNMLTRCYSKAEHSRRPTYEGCIVVPEWHSFSAFRAWMIEQDWEDKHLDKDILHPGNKIYGPGSCVFVSGQINTFLNDHGAARGKWPLGVRYHDQANLFQARCNDPFAGKSKHLGMFEDPASAHEAWRSYKHKMACAHADQQSDPRVAAALRERFANTRVLN